MDDDERIIKNENDLVKIDRLLNNDEFQEYFIPRLHEKRSSLAKEILTNETLSSDEREKKRFLYNELGKIIDLPETDKVAIRNHMND